MEWIKVSDRLPKELETVLLCTSLCYVTQGYLTGLKTKDKLHIWHETYIGNQYHNVTHWMPLPKPPTE